VGPGLCEFFTSVGLVCGVLPMSAATCNRCGEIIIWVTLQNGEKVPVDFIKVQFIGRNEDGKMGYLEGRLLHWDTCANPPEEDAK